MRVIKAVEIVLVWSIALYGLAATLGFSLVVGFVLGALLTSLVGG